MICINFMLDFLVENKLYFKNYSKTQSSTYMYAVDTSDKIFASDFYWALQSLARNSGCKWP